MSEPLLATRNLIKTFRRSHSFGKLAKQIRAVDDVTLMLNRSETLAIVGESGSGKSTLAKLIAGIEEADSGEIIYRDKTLAFKDRKSEILRISKIRMIFEDPFSSINPKMRVGELLDTCLKLNTQLTSKQRQKKIDVTLQRVGLLAEHKQHYPNMFSGGQSQRLAIARAIILEPDIIVADEPLASLDVSIQAQILNLLHELQEQSSVSYIFISHDLSVIEHIADKIAVMYNGKVVEHGTVEQIFENPKHPYTQALFASTPIFADRFPQFQEAKYKPVLDSQSNGCQFAERCPYAQTICLNKSPETTIIESEHWLSCFRPE